MNKVMQVQVYPTKKKIKNVSIKKENWNYDEYLIFMTNELYKATYIFGFGIILVSHKLLTRQGFKLGQESIQEFISSAALASSDYSEIYRQKPPIS